jgi:hypothetical protein
MNSTRQLEKLNGKTFMHLGHRISVQDVVFQEGMAMVKTDKRTYTIHDDKEAKKFLDCLVDAPDDREEQKENQALEKREEALQLTNASTAKSMLLLDDITSILKKNIEKVNLDPGFIKQAMQVNKSATQIISIAKLNLEVAKELRKK